MGILDDVNCLVRNSICLAHRRTLRKTVFRGVDSKRWRFHEKGTGRPSKFYKDYVRLALLIEDKSSEKGNHDVFFSLEFEAQPPFPKVPEPTYCFPSCLHVSGQWSKNQV